MKGMTLYPSLSPEELVELEHHKPMAFAKLQGFVKVKLYTALAEHFRKLGEEAGLKRHELNNIDDDNVRSYDKCRATLEKICEKRGKAFTVGAFLGLVDELPMEPEECVEVVKIVLLQ